MNLLLPAGLLALIALPVIVILHMRRSTPKLKWAPSLRFWPPADPAQTRQPRWRRPPFSLPLLLQLLTAALIALALARPVTSWATNALGVDLHTDPRHVVILLDGSTSMTAAGTTGRTRFEEARAAALTHLDGLQDGDVATVLVLGTRVETFGATTTGEFRSLRERLAGLPAPGGRIDLDSALSLASDLLLPDRENEVIVLTDGAVAAGPETVEALGAPVTLQLFGDDAANVAVVSIAARPPLDARNAPVLYARITNSGTAPVAAPVLFEADQFELARQDIEIPAGGAVEVTTTLPADARDASVRVLTDDVLPADNSAAVLLEQPGGITGLRLLSVSDAPSPLTRALSSLDGAQVSSEPAAFLADSPSLAAFDAIVLENVAIPIEQIAAWGKPVLIVNPPAGAGVEINGVMADSAITFTKPGDPLLDGVDLAGATIGDAPLVTPDPAWDEIVGAADGPLILRATVGQQPAILFAFDPNLSNLPGRVAFPILIANTLRALAPPPLPVTVPLGDPAEIAPRAGAVEVGVEPPVGVATDLQFPVSPAGDGLAPVSYSLTGLPGTYTVRERDEGGAIVASGAFLVNAGHPAESDLRPTPNLAETLALARDTSRPSASLAARSDLWPVLVAIAVALLLLEWLVVLAPRRIGRRFSPMRP